MSSKIDPCLWLSVFLAGISPHKVLPCDNYYPSRSSLDMGYGESTHQDFFSTGSAKGATSSWGGHSLEMEMQAML